MLWISHGVRLLADMGMSVSINATRALGLLLVGLGSALALPATAEACTTILVGKSLTADGSVIHAHNEDMGRQAAGRLWSVPARRFPRDTILKVPYVGIPQALRTYGYWASGNAQGARGMGAAMRSRPYDAVLVGINQRGVTLSCNWAHSREAAAKGQGIRRYAIRQLVLERARSARHGVAIIGGLIDEHGQADWGGLVYNLADTREGWVVETTTHQWVARRVRDDEIHVVANRFTIGDDYDLHSKKLRLFAEKRGWYHAKQGRLDWRETYGLPQKLKQRYDSDREHRARELLDGKKGSIAPEDLFAVLRDRYEGTPKYTRPQRTPVWRKDLSSRPRLSRTICTNLAQSASVAHLRQNLPVAAGAVMWYAMATPSYSGFVPLYAAATSVPGPFSAKSAARSAGSAWWLFRSLQEVGDGNYALAYPIVHSFWTAHHAGVIARQQQLEAKVLRLMARGRKKEALSRLGRFSHKQADAALYHGRRLLSLLTDLSREHRKADVHVR